ncbi:MAG: capsule biosynthesis protein CapC [Sphaerochaetaceae bacterium]|nr:capsule biosynthesis protein CapC [Sphaerochaetaceae bacterium]
MSCFDFHTHTLFGIDHGVQERSLFKELLVEYKKNGFDTLVCTPHLYHPLVSTNVSKIRENFLLASEDAKKVGLRLVLGCELYVGSQLELKAIPVGGKYCLCEFNPKSKPMGLDRKLKQLKDQGFEVVIAHVERYSWLNPSCEEFQKLMEMDCLVQVNVSGIERKTALPYLEKGLVDIISSDNHGDLTLPQRLRKCIDSYPDVAFRMESMKI